MGGRAGRPRPGPGPEPGPEPRRVAVPTRLKSVNHNDTRFQWLLFGSISFYTSVLFIQFGVEMGLQDI